MEHHGEGDDVLKVTLLLPNSLNNRLGRAYYRNDLTNREVHLLTEESPHQDLVQIIAPVILDVYDALLARSG